MPKRSLSVMEATSTGSSSRCFVAFFRALNITNSRITMENLRALFVTCGALHVQSYIQTGNIIFHLPLDRQIDEFTTSVVGSLNKALGGDSIDGSGAPSTEKAGTKMKSTTKAKKPKTSMTLRTLDEMQAIVNCFGEFEELVKQKMGTSTTTNQQEEGEAVQLLPKHFHCMFFEKTCVSQKKLEGFPKGKVIEKKELFRPGPLASYTSGVNVNDENLDNASGQTPEKSREVLLYLGCGVSGSKISTKTMCKDGLGLDPVLDEPTMRNWATVRKCCEMLDGLVERVQQQD